MIPTYKQFSNWSLPSKASYISFVIASVTGLITLLNFYFSNENHQNSWVPSIEYISIGLPGKNESKYHEHPGTFDQSVMDKRILKTFEKLQSLDGQYFYLKLWMQIPLANKGHFSDHPEEGISTEFVHNPFEYQIYEGRISKDFNFGYGYAVLSAEERKRMILLLPRNSTAYFSVEGRRIYQGFEGMVKIKVSAHDDPQEYKVYPVDPASIGLLKEYNLGRSRDAKFWKNQPDTI